MNGFIITSNEFFQLQGTWPLAFSMWSYEYDENRTNEISVYDLSNIKKHYLSINWDLDDSELNFQLNELLPKSKIINLSEKRLPIRDILPEYVDEFGNEVKQGMQNFYRSKTQEELYKNIISGFPLKDSRHYRIKAPHGYVDGTMIGFMDDLTPVRIRPKKDIRYEKRSFGWLWFRLDTSMKDVNKSKCFNGPTDNKAIVLTI